MKKAGLKNFAIFKGKLQTCRDSGPKTSRSKTQDIEPGIPGVIRTLEERKTEVIYDKFP